MPQPLCRETRYPASPPPQTRSLRDLRFTLPSESANSIKSRHRAIRIIPRHPGSFHIAPTSSHDSFYPPVSAPLPLSLLPSPLPSDIITTLANKSDRPSRITTTTCVLPISNQCHQAPPCIPGTVVRLMGASDFQTPVENLDNALSTSIPRKLSMNSITTRHWTEFGLNGLRPGDIPLVSKQSSPDNTSMISTPLSMYTETNSETSSLYRSAQLEFPHPPDPALLLQDGLLRGPKKRDVDVNIRKFLTTSPDTSFLHSHWILSTSADIYPADDRRDLELIGEELLDSANTLTRLQDAGRSQVPSKNSSSHANDSHRLLHMRSASSILPGRASHVNSRKSLRVREMYHKLDRPPVESLDSSQRFGPNLRKSESIDPRIQAHIAEGNTEPTPITFVPTQGGITPSLASMGRRPTHYAHSSVPLIGLGLSSATEPSTNYRSLASPFHHRAARSQPINQISDAKRAEVQGQTSFMNITPPEPHILNPLPGIHKGKVKKLLARASISVITWTKSLANTKRQKLSRAKQVEGINSLPF
ncbi:hypothetical protein BDZ94DRAFT_1264155 [Collybia nuda]|uniref:Uncharacterized protein n=1 Tax=Collybia nuda TaxID=64659 RepID=A0A9P6CD20_9AGAR|nr:hypothetical protein BDZ94DRAFT_1264155 [Collybia nuda]